HASITVNSATGGTGTYVRYEFINNDGNVVVQNGSNNTYIETNTVGGDYTINLYDSNGCVGTTTATIDPFDAITDIEADITTDLSCAPGGDGVITIDVTSIAGDPTAFEYSDDNGASWQDENYFVGLGAGNHLFFARHKLTGCMVSVSETILDPNTFTIDVDVVSHVDCYGSATGEISFSLIDATYPIAGGFNWTIYNTNGTPVDTSDDVFIDSGTSTTVPV